MAEMKTPGVFVTEKDAFPNSVVEVATAVPAFIGYTMKAARDGADLTNTPTRIASLTEFERYFGGAPDTSCTMTVVKGEATFALDAETRFLLHSSLRLFFDNGGDACWVVSVGGYGDGTTPIAKSASDFDAAWALLEKEREPGMIVAPDAVLLGHDGYVSVTNAALKHCAEMRSRVAILDVRNGDRPRTLDGDDVISGGKGFRSVVSGDAMSFGVAYYPWLNTSLIGPADVTYARLNPDSRKVLAKAITDELAAANGEAKPPEAVLEEIAKLKGAAVALDEVWKTHQALSIISGVYRKAMTRIMALLNVMPPSGAMTGVYAHTDSNFGVYKAPANTPLASVISPVVSISHEEQENLDVPLDGKAINAIRSFMGRGVLVWGARTLDGNSQDWRYVSVRRTMIMLEQSIQFAAQAYVFEPNTAATWATVRNMIGNFLNNQWKAGALAGATPEDAYDVSVGLGSTMTGNDILDGVMRVTVRVAVVRPAEFIVITFQQKMQTS